MQPESAGQRLKEYLVSQGVPCDAGVSERRIAQFESRTGVRVPPEVRDYFTTMDGSAGAYADGLIRFWGLDEVKSVAEEIPGDAPSSAAVIQAFYRVPIEGADHYFVFADAMHEAQLYAIHLSSTTGEDNEIVLLDGSAPIPVANSLSQFIERYIDSPEQLRLVVD